MLCAEVAGPVLSRARVRRELLSHGGAEAISLFLEMAGRMRKAADDALNDWVTLALPALSERERAEVVVMLMTRQVRRRLH